MDSGRKESSMILSGKNNYSRSLHVYEKLYRASYPRIERAVANVLSQCCEGKGCFSIADFGTADGLMVIPTINLIIDAIRRHSGMNKDILLVFEDQQTSDFNALVKNIYGRKDDKTSNEALKMDDNIKIMMTGTSMYRPCMIAGTLDFGICFTALHWLSKRATTISNGITFSHVNAEELKLIRRQSYHDWVTFMLSRSKDLAKGGVMFVSCSAMSEKGEIPNCGDANDEFFSIPLFSMREQGIITDTEFVNINLDWYYRTKEDFEEPFKNGTLDQLELISIDFESIELIPPLNHNDNQDPLKRKRHADIIISGIRAFSCNSIVRGLADTRSIVEKKRIADIYYTRLGDVLQRKEFNVKFQFVKADIVVQKK